MKSENAPNELHHITAHESLYYSTINKNKSRLRIVAVFCIHFKSEFCDAAVNAGNALL